MVVENLFGRLKGRWRYLLKRLDFKLCDVVDVVAVCIVLHNMCQLYGNKHLDHWTETDISPDCFVKQNPINPIQTF